MAFSVRVGDQRLVLNPVIEALLWLPAWWLVALAAAIIWQFLDTGAFALAAAPEATLALSLWCLFAIFATFPVIFLLEFWWSIHRYIRRNYHHPPTALAFSLAVAAFCLLVAGGWGLLVSWLLEGAWRWLDLAAPLPVIHAPKAAAGPSPPVSIGLGLGAACLALLCLAFLRFWLAGLASSLSVLGLRGMRNGILAMILIRLRHPRRDFFMQAPMIAAIRHLPIAIAAYWFIPYAPFDAVAGLSIAGILIVWNLDLISPPFWLFLGTSKFESFEAFHVLRRSWGARRGVTLLNRDAQEAVRHYWYDRQRMIASGHTGYVLFNRPTVPRSWSLRTRDDMWVPTVLLLLDRVAVIILDAREPSDRVMYELEWVQEAGRAERCWFIANEDGTAPLLNGRPAPAGRVVPLEALFYAQWSGQGLVIEVQRPEPGSGGNARPLPMAG